MGYTTYFSGSVSIDPPLNDDEISFLNDLATTRRMNRTNGPLFVKGGGQFGQGHDADVLEYNQPDSDQPGLWCQWVPTEDGKELTWDDGEKFYNSAEWMDYIVTNLLAPSAKPYIQQHLNEDPRLASFTCDHTVDGDIYADGEESDDNWLLRVTNNVVQVLEGTTVYGHVADPPPAPEEISEAIRSIKGDADQREDLVILMRLAADTSGQPLSTNEKNFLRQFADAHGITDQDGVTIP